MDRILALHPEVFGGLDDAGAEEVLPHAIDLHAGGEGLLGRDQPRASPSRLVGLPLGSGGRKLGVENETFSAGLRYSPRVRIAVFRGLHRS